MPSLTECSVGGLHFPIIAITRSGIITVHMGRSTLEVGRAKMIRQGWYRGMLLIDSEGESYEVIRAVQLHGEGPFWGFSLTYSRRVRLDLKLQHGGKLTLAEVKQAICEAMNRDPHMWEAVIDEDGVPGWQRKVQRAKSIRDIVEILRSNQ